MKNHLEDSAKELMRLEKLKVEEAKLLAKERARTEAYSAREKELEKTQKAKESRWAEKRVAEEIKEVEKEKARKESYLAREKKIAEDQAARKLKNQT